MQILDANELNKITGGGSIWSIVIRVAIGLGAFFSGFIDGFTNPTACHR